MGKNDFSNIGEQIRNAVEDAIGSMDFQQLNRTIAGTISDALDEVHRQLNIDCPANGKKDYVDVEYRECTEDDDDPGARQEQKKSQGQGWQQQDWRQGSQRQSQAQGRQQQSQAQGRQPGSQQRNWTPGGQRQAAPAGGQRTAASTAPPVSHVLVHPPSRVKGILLTVFGSIGLGLSLTALLTMLIIAVINPSWGAAWGLSGLMAITTGISAILVGAGTSIQGRLKRLNLYLKEAGTKPYCSIRALTGRTGKSEKYVVRDLKKMIRKGILPHAHIDDKKTCLMLNDETYQQYQQSMESLKLRTQAQQAVSQDGPAKKTDPVIQVIAEGRAHLDSLREANEAIPNEAISAKLYRLETVIEKIFHVVEKHPEQLDDIQRFMEYYLPTTVKLVHAYRDFDNVGISGDNITMAKQEVEETLDTINQAFERLLDDLFQDEAFDVSTDASVLQTMLKKDGFLNSDFE